MAAVHEESSRLFGNEQWLTVVQILRATIYEHLETAFLSHDPICRKRMGSESAVLAVC